MPEMLTKYPEVALQVLRSQGAQCGGAHKAKILTKCPAERFCVLSGGELCVYGVNEISQMTQLSHADLCGGPKNIADEACNTTEDPQPPNMSLSAVGYAAGLPMTLSVVLVAAFRRPRRQR
jgi:hypothetical protein